jgi:hypothetical protein
MVKNSVLDTPGHEAFTAMRARGAKLPISRYCTGTADDDIMPPNEKKRFSCSSQQVFQLYLL